MKTELHSFGIVLEAENWADKLYLADLYISAIDHKDLLDYVEFSGTYHEKIDEEFLTISGDISDALTEENKKDPYSIAEVVESMTIMPSGL